MTIKKHSLLPNNASLLERGLELAFYRLLYESNNPYPDLLLPHKTPEHLLPYLAQERGVTIWENKASSHEKRQTIKNAWGLRRYAGTKKGIELALDSLLHDANITSWYEDNSAPYTFKVEAFRRDNAPINHAIIQRMYAHLNQAKSERDSYELVFALANQSSLAISGAISRGVLIEENEPKSAIFSLSNESSLALAGACNQQVQVVELTPTSIGISTQPLRGSLPVFGTQHSLTEAECSASGQLFSSNLPTPMLTISGAVDHYFIHEIL